MVKRYKRKNSGSMRRSSRIYLTMLNKGKVERAKTGKPGKKKMKKQKILALDFDGCIVDSVREALFVTYASYRKYINKETKIFDNKNPEINNFLNLISNYQSQIQEFR